MTEQIEQQFTALINKAYQEFKKRLDQQRWFQTQDTLLKKLQEEVKNNNYYDSVKVKNLSVQYETFKQKQQETGKSYNDIIQEKNLVDVYSNFEKFLFDCFYAIYYSFPKFLGETIKNISTVDLFLNEDIELCRKNIIEFKIKELIQSNNIKILLNTFKNKPFHINIEIEDKNINTMYEISLIRNLIIHNHGIVNKIHLEQLKKFLKESDINYQFNVDDSILSKISEILEDAKRITEELSDLFTNAMINQANFLNKRHQKI